MIFFNLGAGIVEPIKAGIRDSKLGVGKQEQDDFFTAEENVQRRKLEVELEENEESAKKREGTSTFEDLENFVQFLLSGGFYCLRANHENPGHR